MLNSHPRSARTTVPLPTDWRPPVVKLPAPTVPRQPRTAASVAVTQPIVFDAATELALWSRLAHDPFQVTEVRS